MTVPATIPSHAAKDRPARPIRPWGRPSNAERLTKFVLELRADVTNVERRVVRAGVTGATRTTRGAAPPALAAGWHPQIIPPRDDMRAFPTNGHFVPTDRRTVGAFDLDTVG
jgi:hypothetical protein